MHIFYSHILMLFLTPPFLQQGLQLSSTAAQLRTYVSSCHPQPLPLCQRHNDTQNNAVEYAVMPALKLNPLNSKDKSTCNYSEILAPLSLLQRQENTLSDLEMAFSAPQDIINSEKALFRLTKGHNLSRATHSLPTNTQVRSSNSGITT